MITEQPKDGDGGQQSDTGPELASAVPAIEGSEADDPWEGFALDNSVFRSAGGLDGR